MPSGVYKRVIGVNYLPSQGFQKGNKHGKEFSFKKGNKAYWKGGITKNRKKYHREWQRKRKKEDIKFRINSIVATAIYKALKEKKNRRKWETLVGYTLQDLMAHLEKQFDKNMNWENYSIYWEIDHIKPKSLFGIDEFKKCWALKNLQPLEKFKNRSKFTKYGRT